MTIGDQSHGSPLAAEAAPIGMMLRTSCYWHCRRPFLITFQSFVLHSEVPFLWSFLTSASLVSAHNVCLSLLPAFFRRLCYRCRYYCMCRRNSTVVVNTIFSHCYQRVHSVISDRLSHLTCLQHVDKFKSATPYWCRSTDTTADVPSFLKPHVRLQCAVCLDASTILTVSVICAVMRVVVVAA